MLNRRTRSNKDLELVELSNQELARLERRSRKTNTSTAMLRTIIRADEEGVLRDAEGQAYNDAGQRIDDEGVVIVENVQPVGVDRHHPLGVARHQPGDEAGNVEVNGVDRHQPQGVARHHHAGLLGHGAPGAVAQRGMTLGDYNRPEQFYANRCAIRPPPFQRNDFELKPAYYTLVGQHPFHGLSHEHPMDHIEKFEDLVTSIKANGVSYDYLFCKLFPYSLSGDAAYWLKQLRPGSLTTWDETKNAFLSNFYDDARSEELRTKISAFSQGPTEAFKASWARFRAYQRDCPHHGFSEVQLLGIFFRGIDWRYQMALDAASNGNFNTRYPDDAITLIENLASSNSTKNADFERKKQAGAADGSHMAEVKAKLDTVHNILVGKKHVQFAAEVETYEPVNEQEEQDVNFISGTNFQRFGNSQGNRGFNGGSPRGNYSGNQSYAQKPQYHPSSQNNGSFTRNYGSSSYQSAPQPTSESKIESMLEQLLEGQQKITVDFNGKLDAIYTDLNGKIDTLNIHVKKLDMQVAQTAEAVKRQEHILPGKTDANPKYACNAVLMDGDISAEDFELITEEFLAGLSDEIEDLDYVESELVSIDTSEGHRSTLTNMVDIGHKQDEECRSTPPCGIDRHPLQDNPDFVLIPPNARACDDHINVVEDIGFQVPEVHHNHTVLPNSAGTSIQPLRTLPKVKDPGRFSVPCSIFGVEFKDAMCDSGSTVNLMSKDTAKSLGITDLRKSRISIQFADSSTKTPQGYIHNLKVKIGNCLLPTDFHIIDMHKGLSMPLILGRSFLATAGALVDLPNKKVCLSNVDKHVFYRAIPENAGNKGSYAAVEKTGGLHDKTKSRIFEPDDQVLLYDARLPLKPGMPLRASWTGPFTVKEVRSHGAVILLSPEGKEFTVSGSRVTHYKVYAKTPDGHIVRQDDPPKA